MTTLTPDPDGFFRTGKADDRLAPNFKFQEFRASDGRVCVHRDLVALVQALRERTDASVRIDGFAPVPRGLASVPGTYAWVVPKAMDAAQALAPTLLAEQFATRISRDGDRLLLVAPDPARPEPLIPVNALARALAITAAFETRGDPFTAVTGNFDGAGLSFGPLQANFGTGTLPKLMARFQARDPSALADAFGPRWDEFEALLNASRSKQVAWGDSISNGARKAGVAAPWRRAFQAVGSVPAFREEMVGYGYDQYGRKLLRALAWLEGVSPVRVRAFPCLAALFDLCVQQGSLDKAHREIRGRVLAEQPRTEQELVAIAVTERGGKALARWRADCISRRLSILAGRPTAASHSGRRATRANPRLYLLRDVPVKDVDRYLLGDAPTPRGGVG